MFCKNCGQEVNSSDYACSNCGYPLRQAQQTQPPIQPQQQYYQSQPAAYPPPQAGYAYTGAQETAPVMTVGEALGFFLLPGLLSSVTCGIGGIILILVWAFGSNANPNKRNLARAQLILSLVSIVLFVIPFLVFLFVFGGTAYFQEFANHI